MATDFYALLGVSRTASAAEIKKAYRKRARELHPDANPETPETENQFKEVSRAYEVLSDPEARTRPDQGRGVRTLDRRTARYACLRQRR